VADISDDGSSNALDDDDDIMIVENPNTTLVALPNISSDMAVSQPQDYSAALGAFKERALCHRHNFQGGPSSAQAQYNFLDNAWIAPGMPVSDLGQNSARTARIRRLRAPLGTNMGDRWADFCDEIIKTRSLVPGQVMKVLALAAVPGCPEILSQLAEFIQGPNPTKISASDVATAYAMWISLGLQQKRDSFHSKVINLFIYEDFQDLLVSNPNTKEPKKSHAWGSAKAPWNQEEDVKPGSEILNVYLQ
jgi:hypothetical protein